MQIYLFGPVRNQLTFIGGPNPNAYKIYKNCKLIPWVNKVGLKYLGIYLSLIHISEPTRPY